MARNYNTGRLVFVTIKGHAVLKYAFRSRVLEASSTALGQTLITTSTPIEGIAIGVNNPKPPRASKLGATGSESSFVDAESIVSAKAAGWNIIRSKTSGIPKASPLTAIYYVTINGIKYAWRSSTTTYKPDATFTTGNIKTPAANEVDLVFGASFPKPPRFTQAVGPDQTNLSNKYSTFFDPSKKNVVSAIATVLKVTSGTYTQADFITIYQPGAVVTPAP